MARRIGILVFLLCFILCSTPCHVQAASTSDASEPISPEELCSLAVSYRCEGTAFPDLPVTLYKIAEVSADYQYTLASPFANSGLVLNGIQTVGEWNVIRSTLETHIIACGIEADLTAVTDQTGRAYFEALKPGLYLAIAETAIQDGWRYSFDSALVALPGLDEDGLWQYQVAVTAKSVAIPPSETDKETQHKVLKLWKEDTGHTNRPQHIEVEIFRDGTSYQTVILSEDNHWTYTWSAKADGTTWKVVERNIPAGYTVTVEERGTSHILTNTFIQKEPDTQTPPQSGDTSNVLLSVVLLNISGIILVIIGIAGKRNRT